MQNKFDLFTTEFFKEFFDYEKSELSDLILPNIYDTEKETIIQYPLLGIDKKYVSIKLVDDILKIKVDKKNEEDETDKIEYIRKGFKLFNQLEKELKIKRVDKYEINSITSKMENGILTINLPKKDDYKVDIEIK